MKKGIAYFEDQSNFNLKNALEKGELYTGFQHLGTDQLEIAIDKLLLN